MTVRHSASTCLGPLFIMHISFTRTYIHAYSGQAVSLLMTRDLQSHYFRRYRGWVVWFSPWMSNVKKVLFRFRALSFVSLLNKNINNIKVFHCQNAQDCLYCSTILTGTVCMYGSLFCFFSCIGQCEHVRSSAYGNTCSFTSDAGTFWPWSKCFWIPLNFNEFLIQATSVA